MRTQAWAELVLDLAMWAGLLLVAIMYLFGERSFETTVVSMLLFVAWFAYRRV